MIEFFEWVRSNKEASRPWLVLGKGPSFERHKDFPNIDKDYCTIGLNHVCRQRRVLIAHMIDAAVLNEVPDFEAGASFIMMPWQPHFSCAPTDKTLDQLTKEHRVLKSFEARGRLLWYNLSTGNRPRQGSPSVMVNYFSAEAVVRLLAMARVKKIRTLGVDGGKAYAQSFKDMKPLSGGHNTFDIQAAPIQKTVLDFGLDYGPLA
jgi:hypothetical protein